MLLYSPAARAVWVYFKTGRCGPEEVQARQAPSTVQEAASQELEARKERGRIGRHDRYGVRKSRQARARPPGRGTSRPRSCLAR